MRSLKTTNQTKQPFNTLGLVYSQIQTLVSQHALEYHYCYMHQGVFWERCWGKHAVKSNPCIRAGDKQWKLQKVCSNNATASCCTSALMPYPHGKKLNSRCGFTRRTNIHARHHYPFSKSICQRGKNGTWTPQPLRCCLLCSHRQAAAITLWQRHTPNSWAVLAGARGQSCAHTATPGGEGENGPAHNNRMAGKRWEKNHSALPTLPHSTWRLACLVFWSTGPGCLKSDEESQCWSW